MNRAANVIKKSMGRRSWKGLEGESLNAGEVESVIYVLTTGLFMDRSNSCFDGLRWKDGSAVEG